ncbi:MAG: hypothetical protein B6I31_05750 [Desulfobacteraceae bacterium 4572_19]|nr:MAG: hypothetical protein B6I31_05750 [Desulfobacteraceae bacterium 4572_19]
MYRTKVLIVEDNTVVAEDCRHCLESFGYEVLPISSSAEESIKMAKKSKPDVVLMDIKLRDEMDGIEAAEQINAKFNIPVVFLSAYSDKPLLKRASQVGSFGYLIKPFADRELYATLEMAVQRSKADQQCRLDEEKNSIALKMQIKKNLVKIKDINTTLDILMEKRVNEQLRTEETIHTNFKLFVFPFIEKLKKSLRTKREQSILSILESEIVNVVSPFSRKLSYNM